MYRVKEDLCVALVLQHKRKRQSTETIESGMSVTTVQCRPVVCALYTHEKDAQEPRLHSICL